MPTDGTDVKACLILSIRFVELAVTWEAKKLTQCFFSGGTGVHSGTGLCPCRSS